ncbi:hypothetical protein EB796_019161 [Bugula neritina]|uniref:Sushi domain-containing protein n=1 Tax=Bugula neritina TaxID=10212 RepID=A0A7J7JA30_BUGNE|nr:hypothetical protein EB796_019161 [Bugula neritina]
MPVDGTDTKPVPSDIRTTYRNSYNYECKEGYERASKSAEMMTSCDQQGRWTLNSPPICKKVDCGPPPIGVNTESTSDGYNTKYLDYYRYRCLTGYTTSDTTVVQCLASKSWSHPPPTCHGKTCEKPDNGTNTEPVPDDIDTGYGKSYTYRCKEGFETISTSAEMNTSCNHLGRWTLKPAPICKDTDVNLDILQMMK